MYLATIAALMTSQACCMLVATADVDAPGDDTQQLHRLFDDQFAWRLREFPEMAMARGDYTHADRVTDASMEAIERRQRETGQFLARLYRIDRSKLDNADRLNFKLFKRIIQEQYDAHRFRTFLSPVTARQGPQQSIPQMAERVRFRFEEDYRNYLTRLEQSPIIVRNAVSRMQIGAAEGRTPPKVTLAGLSGQFDKLLGSGLDALRKPFAHMPATIPHDVQTTLRRRFEDSSLPTVRHALSDLGRFVISEYIPQCRTTIAASDLPDGPAFYAYQLRHFTTTSMTAQEIHELGLSEVKRIKAEMIEVIRKTDYLQRFPESASLDDQQLFKAFVHYVRTDPRFYYTSGPELLTGYRDICKRVDALLPKMFTLLPRLPYGVREIPLFMAPSQTTAYYSQGDIRNAQPGYFYANTYALTQRPKYEMTALAMHESVPGHHLQIALAQELTDVPEFRKDAWFTAFGEGWALYSERLGIETGMYTNPYDDFGRLLYEIWRACRLVVDPGMHALGWSRDKAVNFMINNTALSKLNIDTEIDRYIAWPGQATAYKVGELKIRELRTRASAALGSRFDLRVFHDVVLGAGSIPLDILEQRVDRWIASQKTATAPD